MKRFHKFLLLPPGDRRFLISALFLVGGIRLGLLMFPIHAHRRLLARVADAPFRPPLSRVAGEGGTKGPVERIVWAVTTASRYVPGSRNCLTRALAARSLLEGAGFPARLLIGVARGEEGRLEAHAWVEIQDRIVIGGSDLGRYTPLMAIEREKA